jgi:hypothetical protein
MTNEQHYEYLVARGFLKRIKEAMETGIYPDKERGEELIKTFEQKVIEFEAKQKICDTN